MREGPSTEKPLLEPLRICVSYPPYDLQLSISTALDVDKVADILIEFPKVGSFQNSPCPLQQKFRVAYQEPMVFVSENTVCGK